MRYSIAVIFLISLFIFCEKKSIDYGYFSEDKQIEYSDQEIDLFEEENGVTGNEIQAGGGKVENFDYTIKSIARVLPVVVDEQNVGANDILISGNKAFIAYNKAGEIFKGALQIIDISSSTNPQILYEIKFSDMDVNCVYLEGNTLFFGGAANPDKFVHKSFFGKLEVNNVNLTDINQSITFFAESHGVTGIAKKGSDYFMAVGAENGGIVVLDKDYQRLTFIAEADVRDLEKYKNGVIALSGATDSSSTTGSILIIKDNAISQDILVNDFGSDYNKATIEIYNDELAFLGLSQAGFKVLDLKDDQNPQYFFELANPDNLITHVTNSATYDANLIFVANGEYGVRVLSVLDLQKKNAEFAKVVGYYPFDGLTDSAGQNYSANHIEYKGNYLFVASGVGGVNVYYLTKK